MTQKQYTARRAFILFWLMGAISARCPRTARARLRDLARLENEYNGTDYYGKTYKGLLAEYGL